MERIVPDIFEPNYEYKVTTMNEDDIRPESGTEEIDWKTIRGFYGNFQSDTSYPLSFVQTSIPVSDIEILKTATEAFSVAEMNFDELIQRDIDQERVQAIVDNYLKNGKDRPLFFRRYLHLLWEPMEQH